MFSRACLKFDLHGRFSRSINVFRLTVKFLNCSGYTSKESIRVAGKELVDIELLRLAIAVVVALA